MAAAAASRERICLGVDGSGNTLSYQWQRSTNGGASWSSISGATSSSYTTPEMSREMDEYLYQCLVRNTKNGVSTEWIASDTARLTYAGVRVVFVNPTQANDDPLNPAAINSGSMIHIRLEGNISEVGSVTLSVDSRWQVNPTPDDEYSVLIPENLTAGRHKLTVSVKTAQGRCSRGRAVFFWENYRDGFGMGRFNLGG